MTIQTTKKRGQGAAGAVVLAAMASGYLAAAPQQKPSNATPRSASPVLRRDDIARVARQRGDAVVSLHTLSSSVAALPSGELQLIEPPEEGLGSGVVIEGIGLILTNAHVVEDVDVVHVRTPNGEDIDAEVIGRDPEDDLALVRASGLTARPVPLGDSDRIKVGDWVVAIGNPFGLHHTVTAGIISAKARGLDASGLEFLQTDAAINPGSSGGPLFDLDGKLVGITTVIVSRSGGNVGLNFAIPINTVKAALPQLRTGRVVHGWLGVLTLAMNAAGARHFGLRSPSEGLYVREVAPGGPADEAGVRAGDVLLGMAAGSPVSARDLHATLRRLAPGSQVTLRILRNGQQIALLATIGIQPTGEGARR